MISLERPAWPPRSAVERDPGPLPAAPLVEFFQAYAEVDVWPSREAERFNQRLQTLSEEKFHGRLKRVYLDSLLRALADPMSLQAFLR